MNAQQTRILIVDDEPQIRRFLRATLHAHGYQTLEAASGREALDHVAMDHPDLVILDLGLPDVDGAEVLSRIREWSAVPIIILSVRGRESDKIDALDNGADDYLTKPFGAGELLARIRTALRHRLQQETESPTFRTGDLVVDLARRSVTMKGNEIRLTPKEYELLRNLVIHAGKVLTHQYLLREVWGPTYIGQNHYVRVHIGTLRQKLEPDPTQPRYIVTEPGVGYRLRDSDV